MKQALELWRDAIMRPGIPVSSQTIAVRSLACRIADEYEMKFNASIEVHVETDIVNNGWRVKFRVREPDMIVADLND